MGSIGQGSSQQLPVRGKTNTSVFGSAIKKEFLFDPEWRNLNHGMKESKWEEDLN
jgi:hercynylcysteine S-oxide lyase